MSEDDPRTKTFRYEGQDIITLKIEVERDYTIPDPQTAQEVIGYYARRIAEAVKLPSQFAALARKVREFFEEKAYGHWVDLNDPAIVKAMSTAVAHYICVDVFKKALLELTVEEQTPTLLEPSRMLSTCQPFPWSRPVWEGRKTVFNLVPCDNEFERNFAKFLDNAADVRSFAKLPQAFGFAIEYTDAAMNLKSYYPDFVAVDDKGGYWLLETKGQEDVQVLRKDVAATQWCENASKLSGTVWRYGKVPQKEFEMLRPTRLSGARRVVRTTAQLGAMRLWNRFSLSLTTCPDTAIPAPWSFPRSLPSRRQGAGIRFPISNFDFPVSNLAGAEARHGGCGKFS